MQEEKALDMLILPKRVVVKEVKVANRAATKCSTKKVVQRRKMLLNEQLALQEEKTVQKEHAVL